MATTTLHPNALPGKPHSFSAKSSAVSHTGDFTRLSVIAIPGGIRSFSPKTPAGEGVHTGDFTRLSVMAIPGGIHEFIAKQSAVVIPPASPPVKDGGYSTYAPRYDWTEGIRREDEEIMEIIMILKSQGLI